MKSGNYRIAKNGRAAKNENVFSSTTSNNCIQVASIGKKNNTATRIQQQQKSQKRLIYNVLYSIGERDTVRDRMWRRRPHKTFRRDHPITKTTHELMSFIRFDILSLSLPESFILSYSK